MAKHLVAVGNSLALVIERAILRLLRVDRDTEVRVTIDGERLVVEFVRPPRATGGEPSRVVRGRDAMTRLRKLEQYPGFDERFAELSEGMRPAAYAGFIDHEMSTPKVERVTARLGICIEGLERGKLLDEVVAMAIVAVPAPS